MAMIMNACYQLNQLFSFSYEMKINKNDVHIKLNKKKNTVHSFVSQTIFALFLAKTK